jgi:hypothetical protein
MITLINRDRFIYDLEYRALEIVEEYQTSGKVEISTNNEGICLQRVKFYDLLDFICNKFDIDKSKITIFTSNVLEYHDYYKIIIASNHFIKNASLNALAPASYVPFKSTDLKSVGCFVGRPSWSRLLLVSWLFKNFKDKCLLTCNYNHSDVDKSYIRLDEVNFYQSDGLNQVTEFLKYTPLTVDTEYINYQ